MFDNIGEATEEIFKNISYKGENPVLSSDASKGHSPYRVTFEKIATGFFGTGDEHISPSEQLGRFMPMDGILSLYSYVLYQNKIPAICFLLDMCTRYVSTTMGKDSGFGIIGLLREIPGMYQGKKQI